MVFDRNSGIITLIKVLKYREMIGLLGPVVTGGGLNNRAYGGLIQDN